MIFVPISAHNYVTFKPNLYLCWSLPWVFTSSTFKIFTQCQLKTPAKYASASAEIASYGKLLMVVDPANEGLTGGVRRLGKFDPIYLILSLGGSFISNLCLLEHFESYRDKILSIHYFQAHPKPQLYWGWAGSIFSWSNHPPPPPLTPTPTHPHLGKFFLSSS